jgi:hypothetical protein
MSEIIHPLIEFLNVLKSERDIVKRKLSEEILRLETDGIAYNDILLSQTNEKIVSLQEEIKNFDDEIINMYRSIANDYINILTDRLNIKSQPVNEPDDFDEFEFD